MRGSTVFPLTMTCVCQFPLTVNTEQQTLLKFFEFYKMYCSMSIIKIIMSIEISIIVELHIIYNITQH